MDSARRQRIEDLAVREGAGLRSAGWTFELREGKDPLGPAQLEVTHPLRAGIYTVVIDYRRGDAEVERFVGGCLRDLESASVVERHLPARREVWPLLQRLRGAWGLPFAMDGVEAFLRVIWAVYDASVINWQEAVWLENALWQDHGSIEDEGDTAHSGVRVIHWSDRIGEFVADPAADDPPSGS